MNPARVALALVAVTLWIAPPARGLEAGDGPGGVPRTYTVQPGSTLSYDLVHKFHEVHGVSRSVEGKARVLAGGAVQVMVRAPLASFTSGNSNRDEHMLEATEAGQHPYVVLKAIGTLTPPSTYPAEVTLPLDGELTFKTTRPLRVPVTIHFDSAGRATVDAKFPVSLDEHQIERPSLMFVKVEDQVTIEARLALEADR